jgi:N-acylneuraminate cytidylyltransferase
MSEMLALIPARGGSKRIPRKNVRPFLGVPAVSRVIEALLGSGAVGRVIVSTDDDEVARFAVTAGAEVPGRRPPELADDYATTMQVVRHATTSWLADVDPKSPLMVIYPTAVLVTSEMVREATECFLKSDVDFLIPVLRYPHPVERRLRIDGSGLLIADEPEKLASRSQDLEPAFHDAGQFYIGRLPAWDAEGLSSPLGSGRALAWEIPIDSAVDIDEPEHWARAEQLARARAE